VQVQTWLAANGIDPTTAERIVAIAARETSGEIRMMGIRDLIFGIIIGVSAAGIGVGAFLTLKQGLFAVANKALALVAVFSLFPFLYGVHLTWRGLARIIGGARVQGAVSDAAD